VNPVGDAAFVRDAERLVQSGRRTPEALQEALRARYPRVVVRRRILSNEEFEVWYVYREGRWVPRDESIEAARRSTWEHRSATI
jgi:hypothetical protein